MTTSHRQTPERNPTAEALHARRDDLARRELDVRRLLEMVPAAAYATDAQGLITDFNRRAVECWGREPKRHDPLDRY